MHPKAVSEYVMSSRKTQVDKGKDGDNEQFWNGLYTAATAAADDDNNDDDVSNHTKLQEI
jgi:hypothetical protein